MRDATTRTTRAVLVAAWIGMSALGGAAEARRPPVRPEPRPALKKLRELAPGIDLVETINEVMHIHGGRPASVDEVSMNVRVNDGKAHAFAIDRVALLRASCNTDKGKWDASQPMAVRGHAVYSWDSVEPIAQGKDRIATPAKSDLYSVKVALEPRAAYQACDRFAFAVSGTIDGAKLELQMPLDVIREEPLREP